MKNEKLLPMVAMVAQITVNEKGCRKGERRMAIVYDRKELWGNKKLFIFTDFVYILTMPLLFSEDLRKRVVWFLFESYLINSKITVPFSRAIANH